MKHDRMSNNSGMILVLALWAMGLLSVFAIYLGIHARQRMILLSRLETRDNLHLSAKSGIGKAISFINTKNNDRSAWDSLDFKVALMNNPEIFSDIDLGNFRCEISYDFFDKSFHEIKKRYGMIDEESKININIVGRNEISRLLQVVIGLNDEEAEGLALSIIDWREEGGSVLEGFFSDNYYDNLRDPYPPKDGDFESIDELLFVEGINQNILDRLRWFVTIYGDGRVNVNTASWHALVALGFDEDVVDKIVSIRNGVDEKPATGDDYFFYSVKDFTSKIESSGSLSEHEIYRAQQIVLADKIVISGFFYQSSAVAEKKRSENRKNINCVYNSLDRIIEYWNEI